MIMLDINPPSIGIVHVYDRPKSAPAVPVRNPVLHSPAFGDIGTMSARLVVPGGVER